MSRFLTFCLLTFFFTGCDIFTTRVPEAPDVPRFNYLQPVDVASVVTNLINSVSTKSTQYYIKSFSDSIKNGKSFQFIANAEAVSKYASLAYGWSLKDEEQYLNNIINKIPKESSVTLFFDEEQLISFGDSAYLSTNYSVTVPHNIQGLANVFSGKLQFKFIRDKQQLWTIYQWQDIKSGESATWSELKGYFN
jgi:hypothetical protein